MAKPEVVPAVVGSVPPVEIRSCFSPRKRVQLTCEGPGRTVQSAKDETDVNLIMKRFTATGVLPQGTFKSPMFGDVSGVDFRAMMDVVAQANVAFAALPAEVRRRFGHDPKEFVDFCTDPQNVDEMIKMGLAAPVERRARSKRERAADRAAEAVLKRSVDGSGGDIPPVSGTPAKGV